MKMSFENELGAQPPLGFWDPLYLLEDADQERFDRLRYVEIKHGRIAMLAVLGSLVQQNVRLPGLLSFSNNLSFEDMPNGVAALGKVSWVVQSRLWNDANSGCIRHGITLPPYSESRGLGDGELQQVEPEPVASGQGFLKRMLQKSRAEMT